jgi:NTP pyrophosphatase (non-canonical NTP hydrolase)
MNKDLTQDEQLTNAALGLCGEAGEVAELIKKAVFYDQTIDLRAVEKELGDVRWYFELLCHELRLEIESIERKNVDKLRTRYPSGFDPAAAADRKDEK